MSPLLEYDLLALKGCDFLIGVDEVGRGAFAGPVLAGAVCVHPDFYRDSRCPDGTAGVNDSKQLKPEQREEIYEWMAACKETGLIQAETGSASVEEIEQYNILGATKLAMRRALEKLAEAFPGSLNLPTAQGEGEPTLFSRASYQAQSSIKLLIDGKPLRDFPYRHEGVVKGDSRSLAIALASVFAKVTRDRLMVDLDRDYPQYGFSRHKGYGTSRHQAAILNAGPSPLHREKFLRKLVASSCH